MTALGCDAQLKCLLRLGCRVFKIIRNKALSFTTIHQPPKNRHTRLCIIGSGLAAYTAAIYAARAQLTPILFRGCSVNQDATPGGQIMDSTLIENFPGFPDGVSRKELIQRLQNQSIRFGTEIENETVTRVDFSSPPFQISTDVKTVLADSVIMAMGATRKKLFLSGSDSFGNQGISAYALRDGNNPMFENKPVAIIGGGDSAMEEGIFLTNYASKVYIIHRRKSLRASKAFQRRALENPKIEMIWDSVVVETYGDEVLRGIKMKNVVTGEMSELEVSGLFMAIGQEPATSFLDGQLQVDSEGYILTKPGSTVTSARGIFAAGKVQDNKYRQAITAAASGCMAAMDAEHYLVDMESMMHA